MSGGGVKKNNNFKWPDRSKITLKVLAHLFYLCSMTLVTLESQIKYNRKTFKTSPLHM